MTTSTRARNATWIKVLALVLPTLLVLIMACFPLASKAYADEAKTANHYTVQLGETINIQGSTDNLSNGWNSNDTNIACVSANGHTGVVTGLNCGTTTITFEYLYINEWGFALPCVERFTVEVVPPTTVRYAEVNKGRLVTMLSSKGCGGDTWSSSNPNVASVKNDGKKGPVTGISEGFTVITHRWDAMSLNFGASYRDAGSEFFLVKVIP